jgi:cytochrome c oxidase cbb3-type subunit 1/cytochrome c oxidase cbb3-type subunit I/II
VNAPLATSEDAVKESRIHTQASRIFFASSAIWLVVVTTLGLTMAIQMAVPETFANIPELLFSRLRPAHVNLVVFGFILPGLVGAALVVVPAVCRTPLFAPKVAVATAVLWNLTNVGILATLVHGMTQAREYAELIWELDVAVTLLYVLLGICIFGTIATRKEKLLYVSAWYIGGGICWTAVVWVVGNALWVPSSGSLVGLDDAILNWFHGHNVLGLVITPAAVGVAYYIIPHATRTPIYSHTLSLLGFWMLLFVYTHTGTHHLLQAPVPQWLKVLSIVDSVALLLPVFAFLTNVWLPLKKRIGRLHENMGAKFVFVGTVWYFITCVQGPLHSLPSVQRLTHFTNWVIGHAHIALLGFAGFICMGAVYYFLPKVSGRQVWSQTLAEIQYWLMTLGLIGFFLVLTTAGLIQGQAWLNGEVIYRLLPHLSLYMVLRAMLGVLILGGSVLFSINVLMTLFRGKAVSP